MSPSQPVARPLRHRRALHLQVVERDAGLWASDESSSGRRALAGHRETIAPACRVSIGLKLVIPTYSRHAAGHFIDARAGCTSLMKLRDLARLAAAAALPDDASMPGEAPCCAGMPGPFSLTPVRKPNRRSSSTNVMSGASAPGIRQFYSRGYGRAWRSTRTAPAGRMGQEVQSNSQT